MTKSKILSYAVGPIGAAVLGFVTLPLIAWLFSVEDVGRISMLQVLASFSVLLFCLGLDQAYVREYHESADKSSLLKHCLLPGFSLAVLTYGVIYLFDPTLISQYLYGIKSKYLSAISIFCFFLTFISRFLSLILRMEERALAYSMSQLLPKIVFLIFIASTIFFGFKKNIYNLVIAHTLSIATVFLVFSWTTRNEWLASLKCSIKWMRLKPLLFFGFPLVIGGLSSWGLNVMDKLFLRSMSTFSELGVYSIAMSVAASATIFARIFNTIWAPMVFKWVKEGEDLKKIDTISEHLLAVVYFIVVLSGLFSWVLPYFLPKEYDAIQYLVTLCLLAPLLYTLSETTAIGISVSRKTGLSMLASVVAMLINTAGNYFLVPKMGAIGAALSTAFSFWVFYILRTECSRMVWRKIPRAKTYTVTTIILLIAMFDAAVLQRGVMTLLIWLSLLVIGLFIFRPSLHSVLKQINK